VASGVALTARWLYVSIEISKVRARVR